MTGMEGKVEGFNLSVKQEEEGTSTIELEGVLDSYTSSKLSDQIKLLFEQENLRIILDFGKVEYMSSAGIGAIIDYLEEIRKSGGNVVLMAVNDKITKVLQICGADKIIKIYSNSEEAKNSFKNFPSDLNPLFPRKITCPSCSLSSEIESSGVFKCLRCDAIFQIKTNGKMEYLKKGSDISINDPVRKTDIIIQSDIGILGSIRKFAADLTKREGFSNNSVYDVELAIDEAIANIIEHSYDFERENEIKIELLFTDEMISVVIVDKGKFIKTDNTSSPDQKTEKIFKRGRGTLIMRNVMDRVEYDTDENKSNKLVMVKYRKKDEQRKFQLLK